MRGYQFEGGTAFVTGAASGIGAALAHALADRGSHLGLVDRDESGLKGVAEEIRARAPRLVVRTYVAELAETSELADLASTMLSDFDRLTLLVNNAGVALGGRFDQISVEDFEWVMRVNFTAAMRLTHAFLPRLRESPGSHIVNVSSVYGLIGPPGQSAYAASKFALRGFTEVLRHELPPTGVGVTAVHPGGVRTKIAQNARVGAGVTTSEALRFHSQFSKLLTIEPSDAAVSILAGVAKRKPRVLIGSSAKVPDVLARLSPGHYWQLLARLVRPRRR